MIVKTLLENIFSLYLVLASTFIIYYFSNYYYSQYAFEQNQRIAVKSCENLCITGQEYPKVTVVQADYIRGTDGTEFANCVCALLTNRTQFFPATIPINRSALE